MTPGVPFRHDLNRWRAADGDVWLGPSITQSSQAGEDRRGGRGRLGQPWHFPTEKGFVEEGGAAPAPAFRPLRGHGLQLQAAGAHLL